MRSGLTLVHSKAAIQGKDKGLQEIDFNGTTLPVLNGYPTVVARGTPQKEINRQLKAWLYIDAVDSGTRKKEGDSPTTTFYTDKYTRPNNGSMIAIFFSEDYSRMNRGKLKCQINYLNNGVDTATVLIKMEEC